MRAYIVKRLMGLIPVVFVITIISFLLIRMLPVDPAQAYLVAMKVPPTDRAIAAARVELGLDKPLPVQYLDWLGKAARLNLGNSFIDNDPVSGELAHRFPATFALTVAAVVWLVIFSVPFAILSSVKQDKAADHIIRVFTFIGASIPQFWLGFLLIELFALKLGLLPVYGKGSWKHLIMPSFTLSIYYIASYTRLLRAGVLENMKQPFVLYAKARGLKQKFVILRHTLKNSLVPIVNAFAVNFGYMLAGSVIVENVFAWPGLGRLITESIFNRDYPMIQGYILFMAAIFLILNFLADIISSLIDPRIRIGGDRVEI